MINKSDEILSAFMDVESSAFESRFCVKELLRSEVKRSRWERYHLVRDTLQGNLPTMVDKDFCTKIMKQIEIHGVSDTEARRFSQGFKYRRSLSSVAIAASVAVLMVWGGHWFLGPQPVPQPVEVANVKSSLDTASAGPEKIDSRKEWYVDPEAEARMNSYLVNHAEYAARKDVMSYVRIVGFDTVTPR
jgi:sigma-E factor negative regulatory protein RseA